MLRYYDDSWVRPTRETLHSDLCVYGGTAAGIMAAVAAHQMGKRAIVLHPGVFTGGMTTGGLGWTDLGNKAAIGGLSRSALMSMS